MTTVFDTQRVRLDLQAELSQAEEQAATETDARAIFDLEEQIRWIRSKLDFLGSPEYQKRKKLMKL